MMAKLIVNRLVDSGPPVLSRAYQDEPRPAGARFTVVGLPIGTVGCTVYRRVSSITGNKREEDAVEEGCRCRLFSYGDVHRGSFRARGRGRFRRDRGAGDAELIESDEKLERLAGLARRTLPISSLMGGAGWRLSLTSNDPEERARAMDVFRQTIRAARALNANGVLVVPGVANEQVNYQVAWDRSHAALHALARSAEEHGILDLASSIDALVTLPVGTI